MSAAARRRACVATGLWLAQTGFFFLGAVLLVQRAGNLAATFTVAGLALLAAGTTAIVLTLALAARREVEEDESAWVDGVWREVPHA